MGVTLVDLQQTMPHVLPKHRVSAEDDEGLASVGVLPIKALPAPSQVNGSPGAMPGLPAAITEHPFTAWRSNPRRCATCGKVASRHAVVLDTPPRLDQDQRSNVTHGRVVLSDGAGRASPSRQTEI